MKKPALYKKISTTNVENRTTSPLNQTEKTQVNQTLNKFFELFANKHL
jgi:hypothetical protein